MSKREYKIFIPAALALAAIAAGSLWLSVSLGPAGPAGGRSGTALIGGPFSLIDPQASRVSEAVLKGRLSLVYFGYTFCPDICPVELQNIGAALDIAAREDGALADDVQALFITIDPERDTKELLAGYMKDFHPRIRALTGSSEEIAVAAKAFRVYYSKAGDAPGTENYLMDHSNIIYLMGRDGEFLTHFGFGAQPEEIAGELRKYR